MHKNLLKFFNVNVRNSHACKVFKRVIAVFLMIGCTIRGDAYATSLAPDVKEFCDHFYATHNVTAEQSVDREFLANKIRQGKIAHARVEVALDLVGGMQRPLREMQRLYQTALTGKGFDPVQLDIEYQTLAKHFTLAYSAMWKYLRHMIDGESQFEILSQMIGQLPPEFSIGTLSCPLKIQEIDMRLVGSSEQGGLLTLVDHLIIGLQSARHSLEYNQGFFELAQTEPCLARIMVRGLKIGL
ncbi:MAG: hypothetical protein J0G29_01665 [Alphaproteobacteria bacterium]|nr:hypothetical protein [Alphaproteobacteria bacterium]OJV45447.1 MAG: hypothetical protein BGO28_04955 [Alphaproteobacteria bacterium 43-37]